jgi:peroxiredoxin
VNRTLIAPVFLAFALTGSMAGSAAPRQTLTKLPDTPPAPDFTLKDMDGRTHRLSQYRGKVVLVNFWATWCPPCRREMPSMERAWKQFDHEKIALLAVDVGEDLDTVFTFLADYPISFPLLFDHDSSVVEQWPIRGLPTTFVVDPQGRLHYRAIGGRDWDDPALMDKIRALAR